MAYDEQLAASVREALAGRPGIAESDLRGGLAFTIGGNMVCGVLDSTLVLRLRERDCESALDEPYTGRIEISGEAPFGFVAVGPAGTQTKLAIRRWVDLAADFVSALPPKFEV